MKSDKQLLKEIKNIFKEDYTYEMYKTDETDKNCKCIKVERISRYECILFPRHTKALLKLGYMFSITYDGTIFVFIFN